MDCQPKSSLRVVGIGVRVGMTLWAHFGGVVAPIRQHALKAAGESAYHGDAVQLQRCTVGANHLEDALAVVSLLGISVLLLVAIVFSSNRREIRVRTVVGALLIQIAIGAFVLYAPIGRVVLETISDGVQQIIDYSNEGIQFLFGSLVTNDGHQHEFTPGGEPAGDSILTKPAGATFIFAFRVLPVIVFFSSLIAVLYDLRVMQFVIDILGGALQFALGTSRAESLSATANIFVGQTEAPLVVRPYIPTMTKSELFAIMCGGLASVAGSVLAGYAGMGVELKYLLAACFMAAPGGLLYAKLLEPETETPLEQPPPPTETSNSSTANDPTGNDPTGKNETDTAAPPLDDSHQPVNVFDAAAMGAADGMKLARNVGAMLLAFISLIALLNGGVGFVCSLVGIQDVTIESILGYAFAPVAWMIGVPWAESQQGGSFIGQKLILNEFVAYGEFVTVKDDLSPKTQAIITFALCGFANLSSIAILLGGLGGMAPNRRGDIAKMGLRAVLAATLANLTSAAIAGFFLSFT